VLSRIQQLTDDTGPTAASFDGFRGSQVAIGPVLAYTAMAAASFRWTPTVYSRNRIDGNTSQLKMVRRNTRSTAASVSRRTQADGARAPAR
jgi:hypothetical protein